LSETKRLSFGEHKILEKAKRLLVCEISEVMGETNEEAEERIDEAAKARKLG
jgi:RNA polymerase-interacting CarD/CdnL/TRCF family regulator